MSTQTFEEWYEKYKEALTVMTTEGKLKQAYAAGLEALDSSS